MEKLDSKKVEKRLGKITPEGKNKNSGNIHPREWRRVWFIPEGQSKLRERSDQDKKQVWPSAGPRPGNH